MTAWITPHSGEVRQFLRTGAVRAASFFCGRGTARARMSEAKERTADDNSQRWRGFSQSAEELWNLPQ